MSRTSPETETPDDSIEMQLRRISSAELKIGGDKRKSAAILAGANEIARLRGLAQTPDQPEPEWSWGLDYGKDLLRDLNQLAHASGTTALLRDGLQRAYKEISRLRKITVSDTSTEQK